MQATYARLDIVEMFGGGQFIITGIKPTRPANPYLGINVRGNGKEYKFGPKHIARKVGTADEDNPMLQLLAGRTAGQSDMQVMQGQTYAKQMAAFEPQHASRWNHLATLKPGDDCVVRCRGKEQPMTLVRVMVQGQRFNFVAKTVRGANYKFAVAALRI